MLKQSLHIALCLLLYLSTAGISIHSHFCKNELKSISVMVKAESCHSKKKSCPHHPPKKEERKDCCQNETSFEKLDIDIISLSSAEELPVVKMVALPAPLSVNSMPSDSGPLRTERNYRPPPGRTLQLHLLYQAILC